MFPSFEGLLNTILTKKFNTCEIASKQKAGPFSKQAFSHILSYVEPEINGHIKKTKQEFQELSKTIYDYLEKVRGVNMQEKRYSTMTTYELQQEIASLNEKARKAEQMGMVNEFAVLERKVIMAKSYLLNPDDFSPGEIYEIDGDPGVYFKIEYMNGVFAWGFRLNGCKGEEALPISMLKKLEERG